jgi:mono/diheme cytochrome c family protein
VNAFRGNRSSKTVDKKPPVGTRRLPPSASTIVVAGILTLLLSLGSSNAPAQTTSTPAKTADHPANGKIGYGKRIFAAQGCETCHGAAGQGGSQTGTGIGGPRLSPPTQSLSTFVTLVREPGGQMPAYSSSKVSDTDLADVYAFLTSIAKEGQRDPNLSRAGNVQNGKKTYTSYGCYECHGNHAQGSSATGPRLTPLPVAREAFIDYIRHPAGQMPPYTSNVVSDSELADIYAFLQSLPQPLSPDFIPLLQLSSSQ